MNNEVNQKDELSPDEITRRKFLNRFCIGLGIFGAAVIGLPVTSFFLEPIFAKRKYVWRRVGKLNDFEVGKVVKVSMQDADPAPWAGKIAWTAAWLKRESKQSFVAFSINCQHLGCPVRWEAGARLFMCPCHGGVYYENGKVAGGPPPRELQQYPVRIQNGYVEIQPGPIPMVEGL